MKRKPMLTRKERNRLARLPKVKNDGVKDLAKWMVKNIREKEEFNASCEIINQAFLDAQKEQP